MATERAPRLAPFRTVPLLLAPLGLALLCLPVPLTSGQRHHGRTSVGQSCERGDGLQGVCKELPRCLREGGTMEAAGAIKLCPYSTYGSAVVCCRSTARSIAARKCREWERGASDVTVPHIIGGEEAGVGEFPHMVSLLITFLDGQQQHQCGGSLIAPDFVLTAAHCVSGGGQGLEVRVGAHDLSQPQESGSSKLTVLQVLQPRGYRPPGRYHDIALLRLSSKVGISRQVRPVCLPYERNKLLQGATLTVAGWGRQEGGFLSEKLRKTTLGYDDQVVCNGVYGDPQYQGRRFDEIYPNGITNTLICASSPGKDSCQGDSGGPLMYSVPGRHVPTLVGIVSQGLGCAFRVPGTYTRVESYLEWIVNTVWPDEL